LYKAKHKLNQKTNNLMQKKQPNNNLKATTNQIIPKKGYYEHINEYDSLRGVLILVSQSQQLQL